MLFYVHVYFATLAWSVFSACVVARDAFDRGPSVGVLVPRQSIYMLPIVVINQSRRLIQLSCALLSYAAEHLTRLRNHLLAA